MEPWDTQREEGRLSWWTEDIGRYIFKRHNCPTYKSALTHDAQDAISKTRTRVLN